MPQLDSVVIVLQSQLFLFFVTGYLLFLNRLLPLILFTLKYRKLLFLNCIKESNKMLNKNLFMNVFLNLSISYWITINKIFVCYKSLVIKKLTINLL